ncbi:hypothetical protein EN866_33810 [Mesorhizobium sp. M2D.F.Ca.ET.223.01.1.1]|uniref:TOTE conflict system archaeo-eukaryotic primase domain-containing protein n=1 Tax=Mesorhizobium sp. M2D.F.Ca.ET.223.01.1.1 TaxID=2563940 RepID=UPI0010927802|nr:hypothetical protein [Mesorhizobium sp. M2D.F.Ca.ET.223.01.1.1]TGR83605.1 hypothetical protein EN866_33810 [Mesorhizobium sp. M2D.F.Ca.ET.223.01.1.1]TGT74571.1 hypothetical protein EN802_12055 [bacterium M00.F.Ca.ET.159.01.1.1]TGT86821.1 hypothetical protein EN800_08945 [bacterium M00.F.Ca.ET.157.01.1.1]
MDQYSDRAILRLSSLFAGYDKAHGVFDPNATNEKGKVSGKAFTSRKPPTPALWDVHVAGTGPGLGIIPLRADNTVRWAVIDIDVIGIDLDALEKQCRTENMPLVVCRSKSGGAHCFLFLQDPIPAQRIVPLLESFAARLGYAGCEIFSKQTTRLNEDEDVGNWLNMPYFYADKTNRYCLHENVVLDLEQFLEFAESMKQTDDQLTVADVLPQEEDDTLFAGGPPCLQTIYARGGFPDGTRNDGMYNVAVYLKKRFPDNWEDKMDDYNRAMCRDGGYLSKEEIKNTIKSVRKKDYWYRCKKAPINKHCQSRVCAMREHGVGDNTPLLGLTRINVEPPIWFFDAGGKRIKMSTKELMDQRLFRVRVADAGAVPPRLIPGPIFDDKIINAIANCKAEDISADATPKGQFLEVFHSFLTIKSRSHDLETLLNAHVTQPHLDKEGVSWFKLRGLQQFLKQHDFEYPKNELTLWLKEIGCTYDDKPHRFKTRAGKWESIRCWRYKLPEEFVERDPPPLTIEQTNEF